MQWNEPVPETATGVYIVSTASAPDVLEPPILKAPLKDAALDELIAACPEITLDGKRHPSRTQLAERISRYWLPDEGVLYIGLAGQPLRSRVRQYYRTPLGAAKPHKGGWWLKLLSALDGLYVHYAAITGFKDAEEDMLRDFAANVSAQSRAALPTGAPIMPFANLRDGDWRRRPHGIANATAENAPVAHAGRRRVAPDSGSPAQSASVPPSASQPHHRSQNVTEKDIGAGQVRIPRGATKTLLPRGRQDIDVALRDHHLTCRWDPRYGPPERSGVIRVGRATARELLRPGDILRVSVAPDGTVRLD